MFFKVSLEAVSEGVLGRRYLKKVEHFLLKTPPDAIREGHLFILQDTQHKLLKEVRIRLGRKCMF